MSYTELPPCHTEDGGVTGYGIGFSWKEYQNDNSLVQTVSCSGLQGCGAEAEVGKQMLILDLYQGTDFCARALASLCKFNPPLEEG